MNIHTPACGLGWCCRAEGPFPSVYKLGSRFRWLKSAPSSFTHQEHHCHGAFCDASSVGQSHCVAPFKQWLLCCSSTFSVCSCSLPSIRHLQHLLSSVFSPSLPGMEVTLLPERAGEGREEKSSWGGAEHLFFQALSFVLNLAAVAMSRRVLGSSTV